MTFPRFAFALLAISLLVASGCAGSPAGTSVSSSASPSAGASSPSAGAFVGLWRDAHPTLGSPAPVYYQVSAGPAGYLVSVNGARPVPVPLEKGRLVLQRLRDTPVQGGALVTSGLAIAWEQGRCVIYAKPSADNPWVRTSLEALGTAAYATGVAKARDLETRYRVQNLGAAVHLWTSKRGAPPAAVEMHAGSAFDRWVTKYARPRVWVWPDNPFANRPMHIGAGPGDISYTVLGQAWTMKGHLSNGRTFDALRQ